MPFDISGDKIIFDGYPIAQFTDAPWLGLRIEVENLLTSLPDLDAMVTEEEHAAAIDAARDEAKEEAKADLEEAHETALERATEEGREAGHEAGFREGRTDALGASGKAADVFRVDALLAALETAENLLRAPLNGIQEATEHGTRRRPVKLAELKEQTRRAMHLIASARAEYERG